MRRQTTTTYSIHDGVTERAQFKDFVGETGVSILGELNDRKSKPPNEWRVWAMRPHADAETVQEVSE